MSAGCLRGSKTYRDYFFWEFWFPEDMNRTLTGREPRPTCQTIHRKPNPNLQQRRSSLTQHARAPAQDPFRGSLMKGCRNASFGLMRLSGSRCMIRSSKSASWATFRRSPSEPARSAEKSCLTVGLPMILRVCNIQKRQVVVKCIAQSCLMIGLPTNLQVCNIQERQVVKCTAESCLMVGLPMILRVCNIPIRHVVKCAPKSCLMVS
jgi:hypothetical protein